MLSTTPYSSTTNKNGLSLKEGRTFLPENITSLRLSHDQDTQRWSDFIVRLVSCFFLHVLCVGTVYDSEPMDAIKHCIVISPASRKQIVDVLSFTTMSNRFENHWCPLGFQPARFRHPLPLLSLMFPAPQHPLSLIWHIVRYLESVSILSLQNIVVPTNLRKSKFSPRSYACVNYFFCYSCFGILFFFSLVFAIKQLGSWISSNSFSSCL